VDAAAIVISVTSVVVAVLAVGLMRSFRHALSITDPATLRAVASGQVVAASGSANANDVHAEPTESSAGLLGIANPIADYRRAVEFVDAARAETDCRPRVSTRSTR
jgi:hypothetical protein